VRAGDPYAKLSDAYGLTLRRLDLGAKSTEQAGFWYTGDPAGSRLMFTIAGGVVTTIQGGDVQICE
jgi:hypothetical protein